MDLLQTHDISCPYCGEVIQIMVDCSIGEQDYIEDCQVCCRPINIHVSLEENIAVLHATHENE